MSLPLLGQGHIGLLSSADMALALIGKNPLALPVVKELIAMDKKRAPR